MHDNSSWFRLMRRAIGLGLLLALAIVVHPAGAVNIEFDFSYDKLGFFDAPARRELLEIAAGHVNRYVDPLAAIVPGEGDKSFVHLPLPPSGGNKFIYDMEVPADTMRVIIGGNSVLPELTLAETNPAPLDALPGSNPTQEWVDLLASRGQEGALAPSPTDFANWGAVMNINTDIAWHFGETTEGLDPDETDFLTLMMHELMHVFGFGGAESFQELVNWDTLKFTGSEALSVSSGNNPQLQLYDGGHWDIATASFAGGIDQTALMTPIIHPGVRKYPTLLDRAALRDVGWQEAMPGDVNLDGQFDTIDVVETLQSDKYLTGEIASWSDGDWNDDFVFDQRDVIAALATATYLTGSYLAVAPEGNADDGQTSLVYDAATGEVSVEATDGTALTSVSIESAAGVFTGESALGLGGPFDIDGDSSIFKATFGGSFGSLTFGPVASPGLDESFLLGDLTVIGSLASGGGLGDVDLIYLPVPEPSTCVLAFLGLFALLAKSRRFGTR